MSGVFEAYARYYDLLYRDKDYLQETDYVVSRLERSVPRARDILELGCGTGAHAEELARRGFTVHGIDSSPAMVEKALARKKGLPADLGLRLSFEVGDVRTVRTGRKYGAVVSLFHVVSYQASNADLSAVIETAAVHTDPGAVFFFDFWYGPAVLTQRPEVRVKRLEDEQVRITRLAEPVMRPEENLVDVNYTVFIEDKSTGVVDQIRETHTMRYLFLPELKRYTNRQFESSPAAAWLTDRPLSMGDWSGCVTLTRGAEVGK